MRAPAICGFALACVLGCSPAFSQAKPPTNQQAGNCSINTNGNNNSTSLVCNEIDPKLAEQIQAIINGTQHDEKAIKDISAKLDLIFKQVSNIPARAQPRRIPADKRDEIVAILKRWPAKIRVSAIMNNTEAYDFAQDWYEVFKAAGWTMMDDQVRSFGVVGRPESGLFIRMHGESVGPNEFITLQLESPEGALRSGLGTLDLNVQTRAQRFPDMPEGQLSFEVDEEPQN